MFARRQPRVIQTARREFSPWSSNTSLKPANKRKKVRAISIPQPCSPTTQFRSLNPPKDLQNILTWLRPSIFFRSSDPKPRLPALPLRYPAPAREEHPRFGSFQDPRLRTQGPPTEGWCSRVPGPNCQRLPGHTSRFAGQAPSPGPKQHQDRCAGPQARRAGRGGKGGTCRR